MRPLLLAIPGLVLLAGAPVWTGPALGADQTYLAEALEAARAWRLHRDRQWLRLGHYHRALASRYKSQVDGPAFFLSPEGRRDPEAELTATLTGLFDPDPPDPNDHPQCRFPARYLWLKSALGLVGGRLPERRCPRFEEFRERVSARSATLVFSSYYLNNPSSAFGHTFLRLNKTEHGPQAQRLDLLDYGVEYAATVDARNALLYAFKGLTGGFKGQWTHYPYYYKVRLYNDHERRDLWEYDLSLTPEQVEMLVAHLWELGASWFDYYYLSENCSYHILTLLEAANPDLELVAHLPFYVIPADTVKALFANPGLVREVRYRPSIWTQFLHRAARLDPDEAAALRRVADDPDAPLPPGLGATEQAAVLDAALDYTDARYARGLLRGDQDALGRKQALLERRSDIRAAVRGLAIEPPLDKAPQAGHDSFRIGASSGYSNRLGFFQRVDFRFALHDLTDAAAGYPDFAEIELLAARLRYNTRPDSLWLEDFKLVHVLSLSPLTRFDRAPSWKIEFGARTIRDASCDDCLAGTLDFGGGLAIPIPGLPGVTGFLMGEAEAAVTPDFFDRTLRFGVGPFGGLHVRLGDRVSALAKASWHHLIDYDPDSTYALDLTAKVHLTRNLALLLEGTGHPRALWEGAVGVSLYF